MAGQTFFFFSHFYGVSITASVRKIEFLAGFGDERLKPSFQRPDGSIERNQRIWLPDVIIENILQALNQLGIVSQ